jgi:hypothetical protein
LGAGNRLSSMVFNNTWFTNFASNSDGVMDFQYYLVWKKQIGANAGVLAESLVSDAWLDLGENLKTLPRREIACRSPKIWRGNSGADKSSFR